MILLYHVDYKELGRRVAARRHELGLKQWQVNEMAGLSDKYLSNIERATSVISIDVLMKLCDALRTTPDYLLLGTEINYERDYIKEINNKADGLSPEQAKLVLSLMDWILSQKL